jgi:eukaryotic-like serine/threonine-protein kinase
VKTDPPTTGMLLGPYEVKERVGGGGMAAVFVGVARGLPSGHKGAVALKVILDEYIHEQAYLDMFLDEARILSMMNHPNIVQTFEYGVAGDQRYIAMEFLLGRTAADVCDDCARKKLHIPPHLSAWICARVADALHYAHELKDEDGVRLEVIHRDANPTNILLCYDGRVKLIDFGLAKRTRRKFKTGEGIVKGKVPYLSPEQIHEGAVDHRSDLYTLGATLWEMTTGRRLWKRDTDVQTVLAIQKGVVPDPTELVEGYPDELWAIAWEALLPRSADRYGDAAIMARDLDSFVRRSAPDLDMSAELSRFLEELYPGEREVRTAWLARMSA